MRLTLEESLVNVTLSLWPQIGVQDEILECLNISSRIFKATLITSVENLFLTTSMFTYLIENLPLSFLWCTFYCILPILGAKDLCSEKSRNGWDGVRVQSVVVFGLWLLKVLQHLYWALIMHYTFFFNFVTTAGKRGTSGGQDHKSQQKISQEVWDHSADVHFRQCTWGKINTNFKYKKVGSEMTLDMRP